MSERIDAIFDDGVLRPLAPLNLPDKVRVKVTVDTEIEGELAELAAGQQEAKKEPSAIQRGDTNGDFESQLDALLFSGPTLPSDFSRADIYADHD